MPSAPLVQLQQLHRICKKLQSKNHLGIKTSFYALESSFPLFLACIKNKWGAEKTQTIQMLREDIRITGNLVRLPGEERGLGWLVLGALEQEKNKIKQGRGD